jgi:hypothetical protein
MPTLTVIEENSHDPAVKVFPTGANVSMDGVDTGKITVGDHAVVVSIPNSGWNPDTRTVTIASGNNSDGTTLGTFATGTNPRGIAFDGANIWW